MSTTFQDPVMASIIVLCLMVTEMATVVGKIVMTQTLQFIQALLKYVGMASMTTAMGRLTSIVCLSANVVATSPASAATRLYKITLCGMILIVLNMALWFDSQLSIVGGI